MKKTRQLILCMMLVFAMSLMSACGSSDNGTMDSTQAPTTTAGITTNGQDTTDRSNTTDSTGVIDGIANDVKDGAEDVKDGVEDALDMTSESTKSE